MSSDGGYNRETGKVEYFDRYGLIGLVGYLIIVLIGVMVVGGR